MADAAAAIEEELEALEALYPDDGLVVRRAGDAREDGSGASTADEKAVRHTMVSLDVAPRTLDDETQQYVRATLCITLDGDYPANPPTVRLSNVRGLDDTRQAEVRRRLDDACRDFSSDEPVLALLCETAFETLTELNRPDGDCAFCLAPVADASGASDGSVSEPDAEAMDAATRRVAALDVDGGRGGRGARGPGTPGGGRRRGGVRERGS